LTTPATPHPFYCPLCNHTEYEPLLAERTAIGVFRCRQCNFGFVDPRKYCTPIMAEVAGWDGPLGGAGA
jgi:transcription elongation factor Elf1